MELTYIDFIISVCWGPPGQTDLDTTGIKADIACLRQSQYMPYVLVYRYIIYTFLIGQMGR